MAIFFQELLTIPRNGTEIHMDDNDKSSKVTPDQKSKFEMTQQQKGAKQGSKSLKISSVTQKITKKSKNLQDVTLNDSKGCL